MHLKSANYLTLIIICFSYCQEPFDGYTLFSPLTEGQGGGGIPFTRLIDNELNIINEWDQISSAASIPYLLPDSSIIIPCKIDNPFLSGSAYGGRILKYSWDGDILWDFIFSDSLHMQHHDIEPMPNGNVLLISWEVKSPDEVLQAGREGQGITMWPDMIVEVEPDGLYGGNIVWEWHFWDHLIQDIDSTLSNYGIISEHPELIDINKVEINPNNPSGDWNHINAIDYNPILDQIAISSRKFGEIYIIDHSTTTEEASSHSGGNMGMGGDILYRWGNPRMYDQGSAEDQVLKSPHGVNWIDDNHPGQGNIIIFNNGTLGGPLVDGVSSVIEIAPPLTDEGYYMEPNQSFGPSIASWEYSGGDDFFSNIQSGAYRLPNGNTIITLSTTLNILEVSNAGDIVWDYTFPEPGYSVIARAQKYSYSYLNDSNTLGDINLDQSIDILDVILLINFIIGETQFNQQQIVSSDLNFDGELSILDVILLLNVILE